MSERIPHLIALLVPLLLAAACAEPPAEPPLRLHILPQMSPDDPAALQCAESARGEGLNGERGAVNIGAVRLRVTDGEGAVVSDTAASVVGQEGELAFGGIPIGEGYGLDISACRTEDDPALWVGTDRGVSVEEGKNTPRDVVLLPTEGFACAAAPPEEAVAFAGAFSPDGERVIVAGGLKTWTGGGEAEATDRIVVYDRTTGTFDALEGKLPQASAMAAVVEASPAPGQPKALYLVGGTSAVVEGAESQNGVLMPFGPAPGAAVSRAIRVQADGAAEEEPWPLVARFAAGAATTDVGGTDVVLLAGGITYSGGLPSLSQTGEAVFLEEDGPRRVGVGLSVARVGPAVVEIEPGLLAVIGGNVGDGTALIELVDVRVDPPESRPLTLMPIDGLPEEVLALARPSAFSHAIPIKGGAGVLIVGGLPIFEGAMEGGPAAATASISPVLYRISWEGVAEGMATIDSDPLFGAEAIAALSQRTFAAVSAAEADRVWLVGGIGGDVASPFVPRRDAIAVTLSTGAVAAVGDGPYFGIGAVSATLFDGTSLLLGGVVELAQGQNQLAPTRAALLRRGEQGVGTCAIPDPEPEPEPEDETP